MIEGARPPDAESRPHPRARVWQAAIAAGAVWGVLCVVVSSTQLPVPLTTAERVSGGGWWPTKTASARADFVGPAVCQSCHESKTRSQLSAAMARTAVRASGSDVLASHHRLTFREGSYVHEIRTEHGKSLYSVSDGSVVASVELEWAFGVGKVGQTFLFERNGTMYEARASYLATPDALHFTPGRARDTPSTVEAAIARPLSVSEARRCFGCHTTASSIRGRLSTGELMPGVTCEACHGPGRAHSEAMRQNKEEEGLAAVLNPASFSPADSVDFCGACHATYWDVTLAGQKGIAALRSQPFRLQSSRCWGEGDRRIACVACHDPHQPLERDLQSYDRRCLSCHAASGQPPTGATSAAAPDAPPCTARERERCATCHMPKYQVPDMQFAFTDHLIRVVRKD